MAVVESPFAGESCFGSIHPDQSYLGRPIDPEIVKRVRGSLDCFTGPRTMEAREKIIMDKSEAKIRQNRAQSAEYYAWAQKVKEETVPSFKLPEDPRKGMPSQEEYIKTRVKKGLRELRDKTSDYKAWVEELKTAQAYKLHEKLEAKMSADEAFNNANASREHDREKRDAEIVEKVRAQQAEYWSWLKGMKDEVAKRPNSAPIATISGAQSATSLADKKRQESTKALRAMRAEYQEWLQGVAVAKFELPYHEVVTAEEHIRRHESAKAKVAQAKKEQSGYFEKVRQMERKHHGRIMKVVKKRLDADAEFNANHEDAARSLAGKMEEEKQRQSAIMRKSRNELEEMYARVRARPMFLEKAYKKA